MAHRWWCARKIKVKQTDIKIAFRSTNTIQQQTRPKNRETIHDHNKSGIYKLLCKTCNRAYIGQTSHKLSLRFCEHIRYVKNNDPQSAYTQHILQNIHEYGTLTDTMSQLKPIHNTAKTNPLWTIMHPNIPPQWKPHRRTVQQWTEPVIPVDLRYHTATEQYLPPASQY